MVFKVHIISVDQKLFESYKHKVRDSVCEDPRKEIEEKT